jgi:transcriptional regulator with XRE-family HTH domain
MIFTARKKNVEMLSKNLQYLRKKHSLSQQQLADELEIPRSTLSDYERGRTEPSIDMLIRIAGFFEVSIDDLLKADISHLDLEVIRNADLRVLAISVDQENKSNVELVETKAEAGYLQNYGDPEFIADLPRLYFPTLPEGTFRAFEITGDSMLPMSPGNLVIGTYVEGLDEIKDDRLYIIVSRSAGVVYKRVRNDPDRKVLVLHSDNLSYPPYSLPYEEIEEVWKQVAFVSLGDMRDNLNEVRDVKLNEMQDAIARLELAINEKGIA